VYFKSWHTFLRPNDKDRRINLVGTLRPLLPSLSLHTPGLQSAQPHGGTFDFLSISYFCQSLRLYYVYRIRFRREANQADNKAATVAVDSLINFEAVKVWPLPSFDFFLIHLSFNRYSIMRNTRLLNTTLTFAITRNPQPRLQLHLPSSTQVKTSFLHPPLLELCS